MLSESEQVAQAILRLQNQKKMYLERWLVTIKVAKSTAWYILRKKQEHTSDLSNIKKKEVMIPM